jgi:hypothetical protein
LSAGVLRKLKPTPLFTSYVFVQDYEGLERAEAAVPVGRV